MTANTIGSILLLFGTISEIAYNVLVNAAGIIAERIHIETFDSGSAGHRPEF